MSGWRVGDVVDGRFELIEKLSDAPAHIPFLARDRDGGGEVEIWLVRPELFPSHELREAAVGRVRDVGGVSHPHLRRVFAAGQDREQVYIVAEVVTDGGIRRQLDAGRPMPQADLLLYATSIAEALEVAHAAGYVHGRLTPDEVGKAGGLLKLGGVGLWADVDPRQARQCWRQVDRYLAPEVREVGQVSPAADVYSLAAILVELATGAGGVPIHMASQTLAVEQPRLAETLSPALSPAPKHRPQSASLLLRKIRQVLIDDKVPTARRPAVSSGPELFSGPAANGAGEPPMPFRASTDGRLPPMPTFENDETKVGIGAIGPGPGKAAEDYRTLAGYDPDAAKPPEGAEFDSPGTLAGYALSADGAKKRTADYPVASVPPLEPAGSGRATEPMEAIVPEPGHGATLARRLSSSREVEEEDPPTVVTPPKDNGKRQTDKMARTGPPPGPRKDEADDEPSPAVSGPSLVAAGRRRRRRKRPSTVNPLAEPFPKRKLPPAKVVLLESTKSAPPRFRTAPPVDGDDEVIDDPVTQPSAFADNYRSGLSDEFPAMTQPSAPAVQDDDDDDPDTGFSLVPGIPAEDEVLTLSGRRIDDVVTQTGRPIDPEAFESAGEFEEYDEAQERTSVSKRRRRPLTGTDLSLRDALPLQPRTTSEEVVPDPDEYDDEDEDTDKRTVRRERRVSNLEFLSASGEGTRTTGVTKRSPNLKARPAPKLRSLADEAEKARREDRVVGRYAPPRRGSGTSFSSSWSTVVIGLMVFALVGGATWYGLRWVAKNPAAAPAVADAATESGPTVTRLADASGPPPRACPMGMVEVVPERKTDPPSYCIDVHEFPGKGEIPTVEISIDDARSACVELGRRLCEQDQWERACRGQDRSSYPYGWSLVAGKCNIDRLGKRELAAGGSFLDCVSAVGAFDMSGNAAEWVEGGYTRGGSAQDLSSGKCSDRRKRADVSKGLPDVGFRCCTLAGADSRNSPVTDPDSGPALP